MTFDIISDGCYFVRSIAESNYFRRQVESREYDTLVSFGCIFQLTSRIVFVTMCIVDVVLDDLL